MLSRTHPSTWVILRQGLSLDQSLLFLSEAFWQESLPGDGVTNIRHQVQVFCVCWGFNWGFMLAPQTLLAKLAFQLLIEFSFFTLTYFYFTCVSVLPACLYVQHVYSGHLMRSKESSRSPGTRGPEGCKPRVGPGNQTQSSTRATSPLHS